MFFDRQPLFAVPIYAVADKKRNKDPGPAETKSDTEMRESSVQVCRVVEFDRIVSFLTPLHYRFSGAIPT